MANEKQVERNNHKIVSLAEWNEVRKDFLAKEKSLRNFAMKEIAVHFGCGAMMSMSPNESRGWIFKRISYT